MSGSVARPAATADGAKMRTFVWDGYFTTGIAAVDEQHHRLVDLTNRLGETLVDGALGEGDSLKSVFGELAEYAGYHFTEEEQLMERAGLDGRHVEAHRASHRRFVEQVTTMWASRQTTSSPLSVLQDFLAAWLSFHILGEDQSMARQLQRIEAGATPADAFEHEERPHDGATAVLLRALGNLYQVLSEQNQALARANQTLEQRVAARTLELALANQRLEELSRTDGLLGIANRRTLDEALDREWRRACRERTPLSLLMIDIDYFKRFNDACGHPAGDQCLRAVAQAAVAAVRRPADLVARYGGEELAVLLPNTAVEGARVVAQAVLAAIRRLELLHPSSPVAGHVTVSIGVATTIPIRGNAATSLIAEADRALYTAKETGRDRVCG